MVSATSCVPAIWFSGDLRAIWFSGDTFYTSIVISTPELHEIMGSVCYYVWSNMYLVI